MLLESGFQIKPNKNYSFRAATSGEKTGDGKTIPKGSFVVTHTKGDKNKAAFLHTYVDADTVRGATKIRKVKGKKQIGNKEYPNGVEYNVTPVYMIKNDKVYVGYDLKALDTSKGKVIN